MDDFAAVCDLAASASPAQWLLRLEERLLGAAFRDPGDYVALAWWDGDLPAETTPWRPSARRRHEDEPTLVPRIAPVRRDGP
ncbi:hypothetical protein ABXN37_16260 [Piscinibacter sakaiensis]|uniref:hypothetical protein n=1 Tax=Piscinibacter sakaiensis TaxID=1547922 RepID=UPI0037295F3C